MIQVSFRKVGEKISGFSCIGHAEYAERDYDIVCAGVSVLVINCVNSIEKLVGDRFAYQEIGDGDVHFELELPISPESELLLQSLQLGLRQIEEDCGSQFVHVTVVE